KKEERLFYIKKRRGCALVLTQPLFVVLSEDGRKKRVFQNQWKTLFYVCTVQVMFVCIYDEIPIVSVL
ncbi:hypothetical protein, partial [Bacteroides faecis]